MENKDINLDLETRIMIAEVGLQVADSMIRELQRKIDRLIIENRER